MSGLVDGKIALVTGGGSGIGQASAELFAREGATVFVVDIDDDGGQSTVESILAAGGKATYHHADVTDEEAVAAMVDAAVSAYGRIDCAHNNAGISQASTPVHDTELTAWQRLLDVDLTSVFLCIKYEVRHWLATGHKGAIVNTASGAGVIGFPGLGAYVAAKHGVLGLTKTAALDYATAGIRVNAICPGSTDTPMMRRFIGGSAEMEAAMRATVPGGELGRPEQLAEAAVWLCSERASWVSGESMLVDGASVCR